MVLQYKNIAYVNLETDPIASTWFDDNIEPKRIFMLLEAHVKARVVPEDTLILLGAAIKREKYSFPVGNVDSQNLYPFTFEEFLWSQGEEILADEIKNGFETNSALHPSLHKKASELYKIFLIVGGMPASVLEFTNTNSLVTVPGVQNKIINDYIYERYGTLDNDKQDAAGDNLEFGRSGQQIFGRHCRELCSATFCRAGKEPALLEERQ